MAETEVPCNPEDICEPLKSVQELIRSQNYGFNWKDLVEPLASRSQREFYGDKFYDMDSKPNYQKDESERPEVLVCHDYKGNYRDDKFIRHGTCNWDEYRFYSWSGVDTFCYFSHYFVSVPTLQFLNSAHRNGVKVIGTIIFEHNDGIRNLLEILESEEMTEKCSEALVDLSKRLNFEGWFFNVEVKLEPEKIEPLKYFVKYLTRRTHQEIPNGKVLWYDSIINDGGLKWQNEMNEKNEEFFKLSDGIFTNYNWTSKNLHSTSQLIDMRYFNRRKDVFVGIDIFGRGQVAGFNTSETLSKIFPFNFSVAIFAPGWTREAIDESKFFCEQGTDEYREKSNNSFMERNDRLWSSLYKFFYLSGPNKLPFVTNFSLGSGKKFYRMGTNVKRCWFDLKSQAILPSTPAKFDTFSYSYEDAFDGGNSMEIHSTQMFRLFCCHFACHGNLIFSYTFKRSEDASNDIQLRLNIKRESNEDEIFVMTEISSEVNERYRVLKICGDGNETKEIAKYFATKKFVTIPPLINNWETRYYICKFITKSTITSIGIRKLKSSKMLLGHLAFYPAHEFDSENCTNSNSIHF